MDNLDLVTLFLESSKDRFIKKLNNVDGLTFCSLNLWCKGIKNFAHKNNLTQKCFYHSYFVLKYLIASESSSERWRSMALF